MKNVLIFRGGWNGHNPVETSDIIGGRLRELFRQQAPRAVLRFVPEGDTDDDAMAQGRIDLYISTAGKHAPDTKVQNLFSTSFMGAAREGSDFAELPGQDHDALVILSDRGGG